MTPQTENENNNFLCPKCYSKGTWKPYKVKGKGCSYCKPKCEYCHKLFKSFKMEHLPDCKSFLKSIEKEKKK